MKMATGTGKTTVMAMLIAWQALNAIRSPGSSQFSRSFLIIAPGITIKDRLRVLFPSDPDNYYRHRELVPVDLLGDIGKTKIVITNFQALQHRETSELSKVGRSLLQGRGEAPNTTETDGLMLQRVCGDLMSLGEDARADVNTITFADADICSAKARKTPDLPTPASPKISTYRPWSRLLLISVRRVVREICAPAMLSRMLSRVC